MAEDSNRLLLWFRMILDCQLKTKLVLLASAF